MAPDRGMEYGQSDIDGALEDLRSDEGRDPVMVIGPMPPWWSAMYIGAFASPN
ncbi:MAG TPA: hypothetical protein VIW69_19035 [Candidatus Elarobacter sp.]